MSDHGSSISPAIDGGLGETSQPGGEGRSDLWQGDPRLQLEATQLEAAYRATTYRVFLPGGPVDLRLDQGDERLRAWLAATGYSCFAIITACNPGSQPLNAATNDERQAQLVCELLDGNYEPYTGENIADDAAWPVEESCFVPELEAADACALAADFAQHAVVCGGADGVPRLIWVADRHG